MDEFNTFELSDIKDPLLQKQKEGVCRMRDALLNFSSDNLESVRYALTNVTILRVYHQLVRIIKYLDLMDRLEDKLYESIENSMERMDTNNPSTMLMLLNIQEKLMRNMEESEKLLQPYVGKDMEAIFTSAMQAPTIDQDSEALSLDRKTRDKLRTSAQQVLMALQEVDRVEQRGDVDAADDNQ